MVSTNPGLSLLARGFHGFTKLLLGNDQQTQYHRNVDAPAANSYERNVSEIQNNSTKYNTIRFETIFMLLRVEGNYMARENLMQFISKFIPGVPKSPVFKLKVINVISSQVMFLRVIVVYEEIQSMQLH